MPAREFRRPGLGSGVYICEKSEEKRVYWRVFVYTHEDAIDQPYKILLPSIPKPAHPNGSNARTYPCNDESFTQIPHQ